LEVYSQSGRPPREVWASAATAAGNHERMPAHSYKLRANAKARVLAGHPWVFGNEVEAPLPPECDGEVVECRDRAGRLLGHGICNGRSQIVWRRLSREPVALDEAYIQAAVEKAAARRAPGAYRRIVWSESDDLPGVVADQYGEVVVVQIQTLAMERRSALIGEVISRVLAPREVIFRNDSPIRRLEGLPLEVHTRSGGPWPAGWADVGGFQMELDLMGGQKTGFYLDQRLQHAAVAAYCRGARVLDAFCNQGSFALHAARAGASAVLGLDSAPEAVAAARRNAERNGLAATFQEANVFDWLNDPANRPGPSWDVVILDPPPFAKSKASLEGALRGYKEINLRAMQRLAPGGVLATYSCSHHMQDADLRSVLAAAASDARRRARVLEFCHQPPDHPVLVSMPESEYLRGYILRVD
jgi:23S rRNA (cytosine1962-C5)-methyltransferase